MKETLTARQLRLLRLRAQRLIPSGETHHIPPAQILEAVVGVQAQELPSAWLSMRVRGPDFTASDVEAARQEGRSIFWTWAMRGTLHLIRAEDAGWMLALFGPVFIAADRKRFEHLGWDEARARLAIKLLKEAVTEHSGLTRSEVIQLLQENGYPYQGQAPVHLLARAVLEGVLCIGPDRQKKPTYVLFQDWLGSPPSLPRSQALAHLARRYLAAYGPSNLEDLASWSGLSVSDLRPAWAVLADQIVRIELEGQTLWMLESHLSRLDEIDHLGPVVRLLPRYDTVLLGYKNRDWAVDPAYARRVHPGGGIIHPVLLVDGRVLGTWKIERRSSRLVIHLEAFESLADDLLPGIEAEVADLGRFLGEEAVLNIV